MTTTISYGLARLLMIGVPVSWVVWGFAIRAVL